MIDRLNPVLVKEVRQALRGRVFRMAFLLTVVLATTVSVFALMVQAGNAYQAEFGDELFLSVFPCLLAALMLVVPFQAYAAMGAEWEENTWDLLVLSDLSPARILLGKFLGAIVQALVFVSAFGPFLVFAYLLRGIDLGVILLLLGLAVLASGALSILALWVSGLVTQRFGRVALMALLAAGLVFATAGGSAFGFFLVQEPQALRDPDFQMGLSVTAVLVALFACILFAASCARLAHAEENRSTPLRLLLFVMVAVALGLAYWFYPLVGQPEALYALAVGLPFPLFPCFVFLLTEPDRLGRRVKKTVPRSRALTLLLFPFAPGGARAIVLLVLFAALTFGGTWLAHALLLGPPNWPSLDGPIPGFLFPDRPYTASGTDEMAALMTTSWAYLLLYLSLGSLAFSRFTSGVRGRIVARLVIGLGWMPMIFVPMFLGFLIGDRDLSEGEHVANPFWILEQVSRSSRVEGVRGWVAIIAFLAVVALLANVPRVLKSLRESLAASRERREREGVGAESVVPAVPAATPVKAGESHD